MTRCVKKGSSSISRRVRTLVTTIRPFECAVSSTNELLKNGKLLPSAKRFGSPVQLDENFEDIVVYKVSADAGGGSFKVIGNWLNVERPQSRNHVQPIMEFTGKDSWENVSAAGFNCNSPFCQDIEDIMHRRCTIVQVRVCGRTEVVLVRNAN